MRFFLDGCVSHLHAKALRLYYESEGHQFCHLLDRFAADTPDPDWIAELATEGAWIIISSDGRITTNPANKKAWHESKLTAFFLGEPWPNMSRAKQAEAILGWFPSILEQAKRTPHGHGFHLARSSKKPRQIFPETKR